MRTVRTVVIRAAVTTFIPGFLLSVRVLIRIGPYTDRIIIWSYVLNNLVIWILNLHLGDGVTDIPRQHFEAAHPLLRWLQRLPPRSNDYRYVCGYKYPLRNLMV